MAKHPSPAKKLRSIKRLLTFRLQKIRLRNPRLTVCKVEETNYLASKPNISITNLPKISIPAKMSNLSIQILATALNVDIGKDLAMVETLKPKSTTMPVIQSFYNVVLYNSCLIMYIICIASYEYK